MHRLRVLAFAAWLVGICGCGNNTPTVPTEFAPCNFVLQLSASSFNAAGGTGTATVITTPSCGWSASADADWVAVATSAQGTGPGDFKFSIGASAGADRQATLHVGNATAGVSQSACSVTVTPNTMTAPNAGGRLPFAIQTTGPCQWQAKADVPWISVEPPNGQGSAEAAVVVAENNAQASRTGHVSVGTANIALTQASEGAACTFTISPTAIEEEFSAGHGSVKVETAASCEFSVASTEPWLRPTIDGTHRGSSQIDYEFDAFPGGSWTDTRVGALAVTSGGEAGPRASLEQFPDCHAVVGPIAELTAGGGTVTIDVLVDPPFGCPWRVTEGSSWLAIDAPATSRGDGAFRLTATANTGGSRSATISVAGKPVVVSQAAH